MSLPRRLPAFAAILILLVSLTTGTSQAGVQSGTRQVTIPYSGSLAGADGAAVTGVYAFDFALYDVAGGGTALWSETQPAVPVRSGVFAVSLGAARAIPGTLLQDTPLWLEVAVRGSGEAFATVLTPRQRVYPAPASAAQPDTPPSCPHDHLGETWLWYGTSDGLVLHGAVPWAGGALHVQNDANGPAVWAVNTAGGNAVRGDGYGSSIGVYGEGADGPGVAGNSAGNDGVSGGTSATDKSGVYAHAHGAGFNYGLTAESESGRGVYGIDGGSNPDDSYAVYAQGDIRTTDDVYIGDALTVAGVATFSGGKVGYVVDIAQNDDTVDLQPGDLVAISGVGPAVVGEIPVIKVRRATAADAGAVAGVVAQHYIPAAPVDTNDPAGKAESRVDDGAISPGGYLTVVTLGAFATLKVDASFGVIAPGDLLVASPNPGYAMRSAAPAAGTIVAKALGELNSGTGTIAVIVTLQ